ncbi:hypothetical protein [Hymenobacter pini]|uniref:hypothetical protein n=1 Tax=Hymenobacter pini TaxID=2880879 RepID=UPI001CF51ECA|nr:hypothetical protein [Hymenobacter pini]MCA8832006.1 hypothetical protein [Hymenobacter pini]
MTKKPVSLLREGGELAFWLEPHALHQAAAVSAALGRSMQPLTSLLTAGGPVALGSDRPLNPFLNSMMASLTPAQPQKAITREQAVQAYTYGSAFTEF